VTRASGESVLRRQWAFERDLVRGSWCLYRLESGALARAMLIVIALSGLSAFIVLPILSPGGSSTTLRTSLALIVVAAVAVGPLSGGLTGIVLARLRSGRHGRARDVLLGYQRFLPLAVAGIVVDGAVELRHAGSWHAGIALRLLSLTVGIVLVLMIVYLVPAIVDGEMSLRASLLRALRLLRPPELGRTVVGLVVLFAASMLIEEPANLLTHHNALAITYLLVAVLAWAPFAITYVASMYVRASNARRS
jgi:hypothetical protein